MEVLPGRLILTLSPTTEPIMQATDIIETILDRKLTDAQTRKLNRLLTLRGSAKETLTIGRKNLGRQAWSTADKANLVRMADGGFTEAQMASTLDRRKSTIIPTLGRVLGSEAYKTWRAATK